MKLRHLKGKIKLNEEEDQVEYHDLLLIGEDWYTQALASFLVQNNVSHRYLITSDLRTIEKGPRGPIGIRGKDNTSFIKGLLGDRFGESLEKSVVYYKDQKFKKATSQSTSGKVRPEELFYFQAETINFDFQQYLGKLDFCLVPEKVYFSQIKIGQEGDYPFYVELSTGRKIYAKKLVWGKTPCQLIDLLGQTNQLTDDYVQFLESTKTAHPVFLRFFFSEEIGEIEKTFIIPVSYTHDFGHFIGEFFSASSGGSRQYAEFVHYLNREHKSEEEISKRIKILKRFLKKIFPRFSECLVSEVVSVQEFGPRPDSIDVDFESIFKEVPNLFFCGESGIFQDQPNTVDKSLSHSARGLGCIEFLKEKFVEKANVNA